MKKLLAFLLTLTLLFSLAACSLLEEEKSTPGSFKVIVVHSDKTEKTFTYDGGGKLGELLDKEGLIIGSGDGMFHTVDGEKADWNVNKSYWAFYEGDEYAVRGIYDTPVQSGKTYKLVYTLG